MANKLDWTDLLGDSFSTSKIDNSYLHEGNYHQYNHKVLFKTITKDQKGGYTYEMEIQCCPLDKDKDSTLCIETSIQTTNYGINQLLQLIKLNHRG